MEPSYTTNTLVGKTGETVTTKILIKNTVLGQPHVRQLLRTRNAKTSKAGGAAKNSHRAKKRTYTCEHTLSTLGVYENEASVEGQRRDRRPQIGRREVEVPVEPNFTLTKEEKFSGEPSYTKSEITTTELGKTVNYKIVVKNTATSRWR